MNATQTPRDNAGYRIPWIDYVKGMVITYVVFTHVVRGLQGGAVEQSAWYVAFHPWVSGYAMAFFFFMSGLFIPSSVDKPFLEFLDNRVRTIVYPYVVWVVLFTLLMNAMGRFTNHRASLDPIIWMWASPPYHYWFFYALFLISILYVVLRRLRFSNGAIVVFFFLLYVGEAIIDGLAWRGFNFVCRHGIFFVFGAWIGRDGIIARLGAVTNRTVFGIMVVALCGVTFLTMTGMKDHRLTEIAIVPYGFTVMICFATLLQRYKALSIVEFWGRNSMRIFVAHVIGTAGARIVLEKIFGIENVPVHIVIGILAGIYFSIGLSWLCRRFDFPYLYVLPSRAKGVEATASSSAAAIG